MRFCYADPPYPGCAKAHYANDPSGIIAEEVDHAKLIADLNKYDAWALSTNEPNLRYVLSLCPEDVRVGPWVKPFASFKPNVNPGYCWEPVIFRGCRKKRDRTEPTIKDYVSVNITMQKGTHGAKPMAFSFWIFDMLGVHPNDEFIDMFPGSGAVSAAWEMWRKWRPYCLGKSVMHKIENPTLPFENCAIRD